MPVISKGNKIVEKKTGKVVGQSKNAAKAKRAARVRNAITEGGFVPEKPRPKANKNFKMPTLASTRG